jgi:hypothetical protein
LKFQAHVLVKSLPVKERYALTKLVIAKNAHGFRLLRIAGMILIESVELFQELVKNVLQVQVDVCVQNVLHVEFVLIERLEKFVELPLTVVVTASLFLKARAAAQKWAEEQSVTKFQVREFVVL